MEEVTLDDWAPALIKNISYDAQLTTIRFLLYRLREHDKSNCMSTKVPTASVQWTTGLTLCTTPFSKERHTAWRLSVCLRR
jgi:hypothetical protein